MPELDLLAITIIFIIVSTLIAAFIRGRKKDKCLKDFSADTVTLEDKTGKTVYGKLRVENTGLELNYESSHKDADQHIETSFILRGSIFLLRQQFRTIPNDYYDAALIDGCSRMGFLWRVLVPLSKPTLITIGLFSLLGSWNTFIWPLIMTNSDKIRPIQVGLSYFAQEQGTEYGLMMAAATFCVAPIVVIYFIAQRNIIESYAKSGIKG